MLAGISSNAVAYPALEVAHIVGIALLFGLVLLFASQPLELLANRAFTLKMGLLMLAGTHSALFHARDGLGRLDALARRQTVLSLVLWLGVIACGRWIAHR